MDEAAYRHLIEIFREEASEQLGELLAVLQRLAEAAPADAPALANAGMRLAHNVKGAASSVGLSELARVAHALEDALERLGAGTAESSTELATEALGAVTTMQRMAEGQRVDGTPNLVARLSVLAGIEQPADLDPADGTLPSGSAEAGSDEPAASEFATIFQASAADAVRSATVRIETQRLDDLMQLAAEMIGIDAELALGGERIEHFQETLVRHWERNPDDTEIGSLVLEMNEIVSLQRGLRQRYARTNSQLGESVRRMRLVPVVALVPTWQRCVVETASSLDKEVRLVVDAGDVELDKEVLDKLRDPIMHLLRNAIDHGIETGEERLQSGKPRQGTIHLSARSTGATAQIAVADDGRGIDPDAVRRAALEKRVRSADELASMSVADVVRLILEPAFSTTSRVGSVSGRGVGLDVVRVAVEQFGGRVDVAAQGAHHGASFLLDVPVNIMSSRGLLVRAGATTYFLPIEGVERALKARRDQLCQVGGASALELDDAQPVRLQRLTELMGERTTAAPGDLSVVVLSRADLRQGIIVDEILGDQELVINKLPWNLRSVPGVSGAAILPEGTLAVALDPGPLLRTATSRKALPVELPRGRGRHVLVADDSLTARTLQRTALTSAGYEVTLANDGLEAWTALTQGKFDLLVSDVQMPGLDGFLLTERVRSDERFRNLPVVLVTSRGSAEDVERGLAAGADEYVVKGPLQQTKLLEAVARHL